VESADVRRGAYVGAGVSLFAVLDSRFFGYYEPTIYEFDADPLLLVGAYLQASAYVNPFRLDLRLRLGPDLSGLIHPGFPLQREWPDSMSGLEYAFSLGWEW
jgi:hypothetical protein